MNSRDPVSPNHMDDFVSSILNMFACRWYKLRPCHFGLICLINWSRQILKTFVSTAAISSIPVRFSIEGKLI